MVKLAFLDMGRLGQEIEGDIAQGVIDKLNEHETENNIALVLRGSDQVWVIEKTVDGYHERQEYHAVRYRVVYLFGLELRCADFSSLPEVEDFISRMALKFPKSESLGQAWSIISVEEAGESKSKFNLSHQIKVTEYGSEEVNAGAGVTTSQGFYSTSSNFFPQKVDVLTNTSTFLYAAK